MKRAFQFVLITAMLASATAQEKPTNKPREERPVAFYKLEFVLREMQETKVVNTRNYMMTVEDGGHGQIQSGARVPVPNAQEKGFQYMDVGVNINCYQIVAHDDYLSMNTTFELSSFALPEQGSGSSGSPPVLRQARASMNTVVSINKQTVIGTIDDVNTTKHYEIAVTATKLK